MLLQEPPPQRLTVTLPLSRDTVRLELVNPRPLPTSPARPMLDPRAQAITQQCTSTDSGQDRDDSLDRHHDYLTSGAVRSPDP